MVVRPWFRHSLGNAFQVVAEKPSAHGEDRKRTNRHPKMCHKSKMAAAEGGEGDRCPRPSEGPLIRTKAARFTRPKRAWGQRKNQEVTGHLWDLSARTAFERSRGGSGPLFRWPLFVPPSLGLFGGFCLVLRHIESSSEDTFVVIRGSPPWPPGAIFLVLPP